MKEYGLLPEDSIEILPAQADAGAAVSVFCERTLIIFPCAQIESLCLRKNVTIDRLHPIDALELTARDALFGTLQRVLVPVNRQDYPAFFRALQLAAPELCEEISQQDYARQTCDQTGRHLHTKED